MQSCEVGPFKLPGLVFEPGQLSPELLEEMRTWAKAEGVGMSTTDRLWSFKKESHRDWFILRWGDAIPKPEKLELDDSVDFKAVAQSVVTHVTNSVNNAQAQDEA